METGSEEENNQSNNGKDKAMDNSGDGKPKRRMKTPQQLDALEKAYAVEMYPSEATRVELSERLGLSDRQIQMWFCHRRGKDKKEKETPAKRPQKVAVLQPVSPTGELRGAPEPEYGSGSGSGSSPHMDDVSLGRRYYDSQKSIMDLRAIACVEAQLGESLREDGPILGMEFDPLPPDAFGAPIAMPEPQRRAGYPYESKIYEWHESRSSKAAARAFHEYQFLPEKPVYRSDSYGHGAQSHLLDMPVDGPRVRATSSVHGDEPLSRVHGIQGRGSRVRCISSKVVDDSFLERESSKNNEINDQVIVHQILGSEPMGNSADPMMEKKRKRVGGQIAREVEGHEIRIEKELEKRRRKSEERIKKERERNEREQRKEEERLMREKQREEERLLRDQRREVERREKILQKEYIRAEKMRQKEVLRREKEAEKQRSAMEKATARKISTELIDDEQLELMELAAASKGLSSTIHLDHDAMQNLDSFRDFLRSFPPESVQLKRPFSNPPWSDSEENIGNLFMVWRFLFTFADVLGLWPFTLDEFVQAFHDYDSRLLGEIHVALLKSIVKDIAHVARAPSTVSGINQYCAANPEGGYPQLVEEAYSWGFDMFNWKRYLNPLTWPEIFRQVALCAGFGPQFRKRSMKLTNLGDADEGRGCKNAISTLRDGSAAEKAFVSMRKRGLLAPRKSRHRLTPGTVKFAAFHVLSLEGSNGLPLLELADKIQKSGLRDLSTSRTPEASISVALTRDTKLFERTAPSTYCVRSAYRKDPTDAEAILAEARKKIRLFENGVLGVEDAEEVEKDEVDRGEVERDEDSECDADEDPEVDGMVSSSNAINDTDYQKDIENGRDHTSGCDASNLQNEIDGGLLSFPSDCAKVSNDCSSDGQYVAGEDANARKLDQLKTDIDESKSCESWIQGLSEGEYSHLSVQERLNALVALIGIANEGNSIRVVVEDRLEAANALKKQMWAEAGLDKSRLKDDKFTKIEFLGSKAEAQLANSAFEGGQSPLPLDRKNNEVSPSILEDQKPSVCTQFFQYGHSNHSSERMPLLQEHSKRSRSQLKSYIAHQAEEMYAYRSLPLGQDRRHNRYWQFVASPSKNDPCCGWIFVELQNGNWRLIDTEEAFDNLLKSLDARAIRESQLRLMLQKIEISFKEHVRRNFECTSTVDKSRTTRIVSSELDSSPDCPANSDSPSSAVCGLNPDTSDILHPFRVGCGRNDTERKSFLKRYQDFERWMWKECKKSLTLPAMRYGGRDCMQLLDICDTCLDTYLSDDIHCLHCHKTFSTADRKFSSLEHEIHCKESWKLGAKDSQNSVSSLPLGIRLLKALYAQTEAYVPAEALQPFWTENSRKGWATRLNASSSVDELLEILTHFEGAVKQDYMSSNFETTKELLGLDTLSGSGVPNTQSVPVLPWIPQTTAAVALRLLDLEASIKHVKQEKVEPGQKKHARTSMKLPSRSSLPGKSKELALKDLDQDMAMNEDNFATPSSKRKGNKRRRGGREQGSSRKLQRKGPSAKEKNNLIYRLRQEGPRTIGESSGRGRRTVGMKVDRRNIVDNLDEIDEPRIHSESPRNSDDDWDDENARMMPVAGADDSNSVEAESDDNGHNDGTFEQEIWEEDYGRASTEWNNVPMEASDEEKDASGDENGIAPQEDENSDAEPVYTEESDEIPAANIIINDEGSESEDLDDYSD